MLTQADDLQGALTAAERAIELNRSDPDYHVHLSRLNLQVGDCAVAEVAARIAISLHPDRAEFHEHLGHVLVQMDRLEDAGHEFEFAIQCNSSSSTALIR